MSHTPEPCGHSEHPGKFINDWTDKERGAFLLGHKMARAQVESMRATLTDFADPDHWVQNDDGEWVWYGTYPPFERPAIDLMGSLGPSNPQP